MQLREQCGLSVFFILFFKIQVNKQHHIAATIWSRELKLKSCQIYNLTKTEYPTLSLQIYKKIVYPWPALIAKNLSKFLAGGRPSFCWRDRLWWGAWLIHQSQKLSQKKSLQHDNQHYICHSHIISNFPSFSNVKIENAKPKSWSAFFFFKPLFLFCKSNS